jgi:hypothetical protein
MGWRHSRRSLCRSHSWRHGQHKNYQCKNGSGVAPTPTCESPARQVYVAWTQKGGMLSQHLCSLDTRWLSQHLLACWSLLVAHSRVAIQLPARCRRVRLGHTACCHSRRSCLPLSGSSGSAGSWQPSRSRPIAIGTIRPNAHDRIPQALVSETALRSRVVLQQEYMGANDSVEMSLHNVQVTRVLYCTHVRTSCRFRSRSAASCCAAALAPAASSPSCAAYCARPVAIQCSQFA